jgi:hypothetical protein
MTALVFQGGGGGSGDWVVADVERHPGSGALEEQLIKEILLPANQNHRRIIQSEWGASMPLVRPIRKSKCGLGSYRAAIMCVVALTILLVRSSPPGFLHNSDRSTINSQAIHDHRQCFDHEDSLWATSPGAALAGPLPVLSANPTVVNEFVVELVTDGLHYNRPPPIS